MQSQLCALVDSTKIKNHQEISSLRRQSKFKYLFEFTYANKSSILDQLPIDTQQLILNHHLAPSDFNKSENFNQELYN